MLSTAFDAMGVPSQFGASPGGGPPAGLPPGGPFDQGTDTLWVFLLELLSMPQTYGHVICWTDYAQAEFKLYKPADVATLWGRRKNRPAMNYDKLSRSLRYYYKKNILRKVPGRKYVYQFCRLDQLLASLNPLNSPIASAYCQIFSQHLVANLYNQPASQLPLQQPTPQSAAAYSALPPPQMLPSQQQPSSGLFGPQRNMPHAVPQFMPAVKPECQLGAASSVHNTPVSFKSQLDAAYRARPVALQAPKLQPLTPSDDEASLSGDEADVDVEDAVSSTEHFDSSHPAFQMSPQTAFAQYAAVDGNSQPESIPPRNRTPPSSQITPSASGSEGRTPSILSSAGEPPAKQANLESSSASSTSTSSPTIKFSRNLAQQASVAHSSTSEPSQAAQPSSHIADRRPLKRKPEPLKFTNSLAFSAANLATSAVPSAKEESDKLQQQFAFLNTLNSLQCALSPFASKTFSLFNPLSASLATPQTTDWLKLPSPRADAPQAQPVSSFTFPPPLMSQFAPLGIPAPLPSPMITTPLLNCDSAGLSAFNFPPMVPTSANVQSLLAAAQLASTITKTPSNPNQSTSSTASSSESKCL